MSCYCTGKCKELGYCPNTGRPSRGIYWIDTKKLKEQLNIEDNNLEIGDEIWFKKNGDDTVFHLYVAEVKDNVFKTSSKESGAEHYRTTSNYSWWEFDNVRILEIERQNNNE